MDRSTLSGRDVAAPVQVGQVVHGRYQVEERLGAGRWGTVYRAKETVLGRHVALKFYRPGLCDDPGFVERLMRQVTVTARLVSRQETIVGIHECVRTQDGQVILVMDCVDAGSLREMLAEQGPLPVETALRIAGHVATALEALHAENLVHGDLRPEHVLVSSAQPDGGVKLKGFDAMWGVESTSAAVRLIREGAVKTLPEYRAPEQIRGDVLTPRADVYGLGVLLYEMLTGATPFTAEQANGTQEMPVPPRALRDEIPPALQTEVLRALQRRPEDRQAQVREMVEACRFQFAFTTWEEAQTERAGLRGRLDGIAARISSISSATLLLVAAASIAVSIGAVWLVSRSKEPAPPASPAAASSRPAPPAPAPAAPIAASSAPTGAVAPAPAPAPSPPAPVEAPRVGAPTVAPPPPAPPASAPPAPSARAAASPPAKARPAKVAAPAPASPRATKSAPLAPVPPPARAAGQSAPEPTDGTEIIDWLFRR